MMGEGMQWLQTQSWVKLKQLALKVIYSKSFGIAVFLCLAVGTVLWFLMQEKIPRTIRIATGENNGQYHLYGNVLAESLQERTGQKVNVLDTNGSIDNQQRLLNGTADLAIVQHGATSMAGLVVIAPLYEDVVHVVVRKGRGIRSVHDLSGKRVVLGDKGSGMRASALNILDHYGVKPETVGGASDAYFLELLKDETLDAAIVTTGYVNTDLMSLLATGDFELLPIDAAIAISTRFDHFVPTTIPRGLYREGPPVPSRPIETVATTAILVGGKDAPEPLIKETLVVLYDEIPHRDGVSPERQISRIMSAEEASQWAKLPLHQLTQTYFEPYKGLVLLKDFMESIVATKDLLFTLGAGFYVLWLWRRKVLKKRTEAELAIYRRRLNALLDETIRVENEQMHTDDTARLGALLDEVTRIKLRALDELTDEDLRGDQMFAIFLSQCSNLSRKLQLRMRLPVDPEE